MNEKPDILDETTYIVDSMGFQEEVAEALATTPRPSYLLPLKLLALSAGHVLGRPRILIFLLFWSLLLPLIVAAQIYQLASIDLAAVEDLPNTQSFIDFPNTVPAWLFQEWKLQSGKSLELASHSISVLMFVASMAGLLFAGGWMSTSIHYRSEHSLRAFLKGGAENFFPFLRTWLLGLPVFGLITWLFFGSPGEWIVALWLPEGSADLADDERTAFWVFQIREILYVFALLQVEGILDVTRSLLVVEKRRSAIFALFRGVGFFLRRFLGIFSLISLGIFFEVLLLFGANMVINYFDLSLLFNIFLFPFLRHFMRGVRYSALARYYQEVVKKS